MSEFHVSVVRVTKVQKHPGADTLSMAIVNQGYPVIFRTGDYQEGDLAVHVPVDAIVPATDARWAFLGGHTRIVAKKLRGVFSMGVLTPADPAWVEGQNVQEALGIIKHEDAIHPGGGDGEQCPFFVPQYTDVERLRRWPYALKEWENVVIREKIHGENMRAVWQDGRLWVGSRVMMKADTLDSQWWRAARAEGLEEKLKRQPGVMVFGEAHGYTKGFPYGVKPGQAGFRAFDAMTISTRRYLDHPEFADLMGKLGVPVAPLLFKGPWTEDLRALAEGQSTIDPRHVREGFVVKPTTERDDPRFGRVILKLVGQGYLLRNKG